MKYNFFLFLILTTILNNIFAMQNNTIKFNELSHQNMLYFRTHYANNDDVFNETQLFNAMQQHHIARQRQTLDEMCYLCCLLGCIKLTKWIYKKYKEN